jgi:hypothetical protein
MEDCAEISPIAIPASNSSVSPSLPHPLAIVTTHAVMRALDLNKAFIVSR